MLKISDTWSHLYAEKEQDRLLYLAHIVNETADVHSVMISPNIIIIAASITCF